MPSVADKTAVTAAAWLVPCLSVTATDKRRAVRAVLAAAAVPIVAVIYSHGAGADNLLGSNDFH